MTIRLLRPFNGIAANQVVSLDTATEAALVSQLAASYQLLGVTPAEPNAFGSAQAAIEVPIPMGGYRTVLCGDSMTDLYEFVNNPTADYNPSTGVITISDSTHRVGTGWPVVFYNRNYMSIRSQRFLTATRIGPNTFTLQLPDRPTDLPSGSLAGTNFVRYPNRRNQQSWFLWLQMLMGHPFNVVNNGAQSGDTTADVLTRLTQDVLTYQPDVVFMQIPGINDQGSANGPVAEQITWANLQNIITQIANTGAFIVAVTMTPVFTGEARATVQNMQRVKNLNYLLRQYAQTVKNMMVVDSYKLIADPASATGLARQFFLKASDNIHYNQKGAYVVGKAVRAAISNLFPGQFQTLPQTQADCFAGSAITVTNGSTSSTGGTATVTATAHGYRVGELIGITGATGGSIGLNGWWVVATVPTANTFTVITSGADFASASGTVTTSRNRNLFGNPVANNTNSGGTVSGAGASGTAAALFTVTGALAGSPTIVASVPAAWTGNGNAQRIVCSAASVDNSWGYQNTSITGLFVNQMAPGRTYFFEAQMQVTSSDYVAAPISEVYAEFIVQMDSSYLVASRASEVFDSAVDIAGEPFTVHLKTNNFTVPAGTITQAYFQIWVRAGATFSAGPTITSDLTSVALWQVAPA